MILWQIIIVERPAAPKGETIFTMKKVLKPRRMPSPNEGKKCFRNSEASALAGRMPDLGNVSFRLPYPLSTSVISTLRERKRDMSAASAAPRIPRRGKMKNPKTRRTHKTASIALVTAEIQKDVRVSPSARRAVIIVMEGRAMAGISEMRVKYCTAKRITSGSRAMIPTRRSTKMQYRAGEGHGNGKYDGGVDVANNHSGQGVFAQASNAGHIDIHICLLEHQHAKCGEGEGNQSAGNGSPGQVCCHLCLENIFLKIL